MKVSNALYSDFAAYRKAWNDACAWTPATPLNVDLELSTVCNLRCPFCYNADPSYRAFMDEPVGGRHRARFMDAEMVADVIDDAADIGVPALKFNGRGESTMHPDYSAVILAARDTKAFHDLLVNTNGQCRPDALIGLMAATKCVVSLDTCDEARYETIRVGGEFARVVNNIKLMIAMGHRNLWIRRVVTDANRDEDFLAGCRRLFGDEGYHVAEHACFDRGPDHATDAKCPRIYCAQPSQRLFVTATGEILACCNDVFQRYVVGHIKDGLMAAWNGKAISDLRRRLKLCDVWPITWPEHCQNCTSWISYDHPNRALLGDKELI